MSYRLINSNDLAIKYPEVNDMPCIYADLPNGLDGNFYKLLVQCKDCKYSEPQCSTTKAILPLECKYRRSVGLDWFCEHGEKVSG